MTESEDTDMSVLEKGIYKKDRAAYETLTLKNENCSLTVCPEKGGMVISFKKGNEEYIWLRDGNFEKDERPRCGIPILSPTVVCLIMASMYLPANPTRLKTMALPICCRGKSQKQLMNTSSLN